MRITDIFPKKPKVFISYRRETSSDFVILLVEKLKEKFTVFCDLNPEHQEIGELWPPLKKDIDKCTHFVLVVDEGTFKFKDNKENEDILWREINYALIRYKKYKRFKIIPFITGIKIIPLSINGNKIPIEKKLQEDGIENFNNYTFIKLDYNENNDFDAFISDFVKKKLGYDELKEKKKKKIRQSLYSVAVAVLLVFGGALLQKYISSKAPIIPEPIKLVFAGGGSVKNVIKNITHDSVDIKNYEKSIYLDLPSENAWALMAEEVMINHTSISENNKFYPVCLSALEAKTTDFLKGVEKDEFEKKGTILSYHFKDYDDPLIVYSDMFQGEQGTITFESLSKIITNSCKNPLFKVYITREGSGTYSIYKERLIGILEKEPVKSHLDYYNEGLETKNLPDTGLNCIVLSSQYYTPIGIKDLKYKMMVNEGGDTISKPMYLYFAGYTNEDSGYITIPEQMVSFLRHIDNDTVIKTKMRQRAKMVITPFNTLKYWQKKK